MPDDFEVISKRFVPIWRSTKARRERGLKRYALFLITLVCLGLLLIPPYQVPISFQLAQGHTGAWLLFGALAMALAYLSKRFWNHERPFSAAFCWLSIGGLVLIATTDPFSTNHLGVFAFLCLSLLDWLWSIQREIQDFRLFGSASVATVGALSCLLGALGVGERVMLVGALVGMNVLFYEYVIF